MRDKEGIASRFSDLKSGDYGDTILERLRGLRGHNTWDYGDTGLRGHRDYGDTTGITGTPDYGDTILNLAGIT